MRNPSASSLLKLLCRLRRWQEMPDPALSQLEQIDWSALSWIFLTSWTGGTCEIASGLDIGQLDWHPVIDPESRQQRRADGIDGVYGNRHILRVWHLATGGSIGLFAAEEVSNGVWVVFVPKA